MRSLQRSATSFGPPPPLSALAARLLGACVEKPNHLRCGDWEQRVLMRDQVRYAALDAFASLRIYEARTPFSQHLLPFSTRCQSVKQRVSCSCRGSRSPRTWPLLSYQSTE